MFESNAGHVLYALRPENTEPCTVGKTHRITETTPAGCFGQASWSVVSTSGRRLGKYGSFAESVPEDRKHDTVVCVGRRRCGLLSSDFVLCEIKVAFMPYFV
ncbi:unnamed protein product [Fusarium graminearum]|uniref:Chromosome 3, complete genome n=1 Tax=Gibberella zeae (strain ATCC MYA-4620 / CBS 123657 / FGSC 9075 / NRRL 31084 / PH-1) TaxID=229533 RepID=I1S7T9_GIBZE|nr:hypothetical protein FGSG_12914 [Fusarium graminearum PH-1]ESU12483.1 hypothetical protein FGSG_12914 [Fusarium graminearum PH-1]CEF87473.1 unnamed protein product [Fusarium graminearum]CZS85200.1 unnamed protein product [Fusarium graminearum]|eukprot:XP_011325059.1 hypothetical protein FGSG_12914 [Fusarium graminearum PH-1]